MSGYRLRTGGLVDRTRALRFTFNGKLLTGFAGDTLASALMARGVDTVARSFKFHRPRGICAAGVEEPNALVQLVAPHDEPNVLATTLPLIDGLAATSQNCWPSVGFDLGATADAIHAFLPAGFQYKTFMSPPGGWPWYERMIRRAAGIGNAPRRAASIDVERRYAHCDVLIVGAGPAGLMAALTASQAGVRVILADIEPHVGGALLSSPASIEGDDAQQWIQAAIAELDANACVSRLPRTTVTGYHDHNFLTAIERDPFHRERLWKIRARHVILATGAFERPLLFPSNDVPGVMLLSAIQAFAHRYGVAAGQRVVIVTNHSGAYRSAGHLRDAGVFVVAIIDLREEVAQRLVEDVAMRGIEVVPGQTIIAVHGRLRVTAITVAPLSQLTAGRTIDCDVVAMAGGWQPVLHLHSQSGGRIEHSESHDCFVPGIAAQASMTAGAVNGHDDLTMCLREGVEAGNAVVQALGGKHRDVAIPHCPPAEALDLLPLMPVGALPNPRGERIFVDFQSDVTTDDIRLAYREGYASIEHAKRYTTAGMGIDQGKTASANTVAELAQAVGIAPAAIGLSSMRPPCSPVAFGTIAGREPGALIRPVRETPFTAWHIANDAVLYESGANWRRPGYYLRANETISAAIRRECLAVRQSVGIYDSSPLGKIEVQGPDAATFLDRIYASRIRGLAIGRGRYALMLREDGRLFDDGVVFRLGSDRYWLTTTAANAESVAAWLEFHLQCVWPLRVFITLVSSQWANAVVCGPRAREVISVAETSIPLDEHDFPFMSVRTGVIGGVRVRVARVSFTGELSYEINVGASAAMALWNGLIRAGMQFGITAVGSEANHVLRIEKGYISISHEADGMAMPFDLGLHRFVAMDKADFIGRRSLQADRLGDGPRHELVGLLTDDPSIVLPEGAQILESMATRACGFVSAAVASPTLGRSIAHALVERGRSKLGAQLRVTLDRGEAAVRVVEPVFVDPNGERLRG